jgi:hypothetical protein
MPAEREIGRRPARKASNLPIQRARGSLFCRQNGANGAAAFRPAGMPWLIVALLAAPG